MTRNMLHHRWIALPSELLLLLLTLVCSPGTNAQNSDGSDGGGVEFQALEVSLINHGTAAASDSVKTAAAKGTSGSVVATHNAVRGSVLATNMQYVDQDSSLTRDVKTWLSQCSYSDDLVVHWNDVTYPYVNGFLATLPSPDSISGVVSLINRKPTLDTYYRLLMKSDIRYLGCGSVKCPHLGSTFVACVYASRSELNLAKAPYESGEPCTECSSGIYWCNDNLCRDDCYTANAHCECRVDCGRDSTVSSNCSCLCPSGRAGNKCQESTETTATSCLDCDGWGQGGTTLIVCVTLVLLVLLCVSLCLVLYHKKYRLSKQRAHSSSSSNSAQSSPTRRNNIYTTSSSASSTSSSSPPSFDSSKYPSPPPAYTSVNLTPDLDPPPYGFTASPTDAAEEVGHDGSTPPPPPYPNQEVDV